MGNAVLESNARSTSLTRTLMSEKERLVKMKVVDDVGIVQWFHKDQFIIRGPVGDLLAEPHDEDRADGEEEGHQERGTESGIHHGAGETSVKIEKPHACTAASSTVA